MLSSMEVLRGRGRPRTAQYKRVSIQFRSNVADKWNSLRTSLSKTHDEFSMYLMEFYERYKVTVASGSVDNDISSLPRLAPIKKTALRGLYQQGSSSTHVDDITPILPYDLQDSITAYDSQALFHDNVSTVYDQNDGKFLSRHF